VPQLLKKILMTAGVAESLIPSYPLRTGMLIEQALEDVATGDL